MKTAISIPDDVFARAEQLARSKGFTRSQLFTRAVIFYMEQGASTNEDKVATINGLVDELGPDIFAAADMTRVQLNALADEGW